MSINDNLFTESEDRSLILNRKAWEFEVFFAANEHRIQPKLQPIKICVHF